MAVFTAPDTQKAAAADREAELAADLGPQVDPPYGAVSKRGKKHKQNKATPLDFSGFAPRGISRCAGETRVSSARPGRLFLSFSAPRGAVTRGG